MSEAVLIEIAQRFRKLEDRMESLGPHLEFELAAMERKRAEWSGESNYSATQFEKWSRRIEDYEALREDLQRGMEACREDMVSMQEQIRKVVL